MTWFSSRGSSWPNTLRAWWEMMIDLRFLQSVTWEWWSSGWRCVPLGMLIKLIFPVRNSWYQNFLSLRERMSWLRCCWRDWISLARSTWYQPPSSTSTSSVSRSLPRTPLRRTLSATGPSSRPWLVPSWMRIMITNQWLNYLRFLDPKHWSTGG